MSTAPAEMDCVFGVYERFNQPEFQEFARLKHRIHSLPEELFPSDTLPDRLARALAKHRVVHLKELVESFEFFYRTRKRLRAHKMVDLCSGHGLVGLIYALAEKRVQEVHLIDHQMPETQGRIIDAFIEIAPWVADKIKLRPEALTPELSLPQGSSILLVHACGSLTDLGIELAIRGRHRVAALPCCYGKAFEPKVLGLARVYGRQDAIDISRSYRLADHEYDVDWNCIPRAISKMNRIIVGIPR